jgi:hypothetical protein
MTHRIFRNVLVVGAAVLLGCAGKVTSSARGTELGSGGSAGGTYVDSIGGRSADNPPLPDGQRFVFEVGRVLGWGLGIEGIYVTRDGEVYEYGSYDFPSGSDYAAAIAAAAYQSEMTEEQIAAKHGQAPSLVATVPQQEVLARHAAVEAARTGALLYRFACNDAGEDTYVAWVYDPPSATYFTVTLGVRGDLPGMNTTVDAQDLVGWLAGLAGRGDEMCVYEAKTDCVKVDCPDSPCVYPWETHAGDCAGPCVRNGCAGVPACNTCTGGEICVVVGSGFSCSAPYVPDCSGEPTCDCAGDAICAGGSSWCRGSPEVGFSCQAP